MLHGCIDMLLEGAACLVTRRTRLELPYRSPGPFFVPAFIAASHLPIAMHLYLFRGNPGICRLFCALP